MRSEASLILGGTLFASGMVAVSSGAGQTLEWQELGVGGGMAGAVLSLPLYLRWLAGRTADGRAGAAVPHFWKGIASLVLFGFWFCAALSLNTAWSFAPVERTQGIVNGKRVAKGRHGDSHYAQIATPRGPIEAGMPRDVWSGVVVGQRVQVLVCRGLLGYPYLVTPLDRGPYLDIKGLLGLRSSAAGPGC